MTSLPPAPPPTDPTVRAAVALARAEARREMLEYLADWGMSLSKDICTRSMDSPYHPELKHDPGRSFASASRAVRLTLAMEERVETYILALCNGVAPSPAPAVAASAAGKGGARREGLRDEGPEPAIETVERDIGDGGESREREWERLVEAEDFGEVLAGDLDAGVSAIRAELQSLSAHRKASQTGSPSHPGIEAPSPEPESETSLTTPSRPSQRFSLDRYHQWNGSREPYRASG